MLGGVVTWSSASARAGLPVRTRPALDAKGMSDQRDGSPATVGGSHARTSTYARRRSSASARWSAQGSSRCSAPPARWRARPCGCRSSSRASIAVLQGYSFAKFGARYPSAGRTARVRRRGFGDGHFTGIIAWLFLAANAIITAHGRGVVRQLRERSRRRRQRRLGQGVRGARRRGDDPAQHRRLAGRRQGADRRRLRRARHPHAVRGHDPGQSRPRPARVLGLPVRSPTSCRASR